MMKKKLMSAVVLMCAVLSFAAGTKDKDKKSGKELSVVTTIFPVFDFTRAVMYGAPDAKSGKVSEAVSAAVQSDASLKMLVKPGMEIHSFDPSPADIAAIQNADVFIYIGGESDEWVHDILESMDMSGKTVVRLSDYVDLVEEEIVEGMEHNHDHDAHKADDHSHKHKHTHDGHEHKHKGDGHDHESDEHEHEADEHIWTSPANAVKMVEAIRDALVQADMKKSGGKKADSFVKNAADYCGQIQNTANAISAVVENAHDKFILVGDRFPLRYFADYYGLTYSAAFSGCSTAVEADAATIAGLIDKTVKKGTRAIFSIELSNQKIAKTIAEGAYKASGQSIKPDVLELHSVHNVTKNDFKAGETWVSLMMRNAQVLKQSL